MGSQELDMTEYHQASSFPYYLFFFFFFQSLTTSDILCTLLIVFVYCLCSPLECKLHEGRNFYLIFYGLDKYIESMSE